MTESQFLKLKSSFDGHFLSVTKEFIELLKMDFDKVIIGEKTIVAISEKYGSITIAFMPDNYRGGGLYE
jgi:hypothetical protein